MLISASSIGVVIGWNILIETIRSLKSIESIRIITNSLEIKLAEFLTENWIFLDAWITWKKSIKNLTVLLN